MDDETLQLSQLNGSDYLQAEATRREVIKRLGLVAMASVFGFTRPDGAKAMMKSSHRLTLAPPEIPRKSIVSMAQHTDHATAIRLSLAKFDSLKFVKAGDTVVLKVNTNSGDPYPYSTSPTMIQVLGAMLNDRGAKVIVGDRSFWGDSGTAQNLARNGIAAAAKKVGAKLIVFEDKSTRWVPIPSKLVPHWNGRIHVPECLVSATHVFNLPCVKTHFITTYTMALKNMLGIIRAGDRKRPGNLLVHSQAKIYKQIAQINRAITPTLNILDGHSALVTGGPTPRSGATPTIKPCQIVAVSADRIALDVIGIALLKQLSPKTERVTRLKTWSNPMIKAAVTEKLGIDSAKKLHVHGPTVKNLAQLIALASS